MKKIIKILKVWLTDFKKVYILVSLLIVRVIVLNAHGYFCATDDINCRSLIYYPLQQIFILSIFILLTFTSRQLLMIRRSVGLRVFFIAWCFMEIWNCLLVSILLLGYNGTLLHKILTYDYFRSELRFLYLALASFAIYLISNSYKWKRIIQSDIYDTSKVQVHGKKGMDLLDALCMFIKGIPVSNFKVTYDGYEIKYNRFTGRVVCRYYKPDNRYVIKNTTLSPDNFYSDVCSKLGEKFHVLKGQHCVKLANINVTNYFTNDSPCN